MCVRSADNVCDAVGDGHFSHLDGHFERFGTVVQLGKYVAMNVDHCNRE